MRIERAIHSVGKLVVLVGLPAWIGVADKPTVVFAVYATLASSLLGFAETLSDSAAHAEHSPPLVAMRFVVWATRMGLVGGLSYAVAILAV